MYLTVTQNEICNYGLARKSTTDYLLFLLSVPDPDFPIFLWLVECWFLSVWWCMCISVRVLAEGGKMKYICTMGEWEGEVYGIYGKTLHLYFGRISDKFYINVISPKNTLVV